MSFQSSKIWKQLEDVTPYDMHRFNTIRRYLTLLKDGKNRERASLDVAELFYVRRDQDGNPIPLDADCYICRRLRRWADHYVNEGALPEHR
jgi:hypothetical protein